MNKTVALETLRRMAEGIAMMFGSSCETLIHDMSVPNHPILAIYNSHVSGRDIGSKEDIFGSKIDADNTYIGKDYVNHLVVTPKGKYIKSSTFNFAGEDYHYALGINFDFTPLVSSSKMLGELAAVGTALEAAVSEAREIHLKDVFEETFAGFGKPAENLNKRERLELIAKLQQNGFFSYQKSVPFLAERLQVSRYTIYKYMKESAENSPRLQRGNGAFETRKDS
jgi:predicted transcriptional regulator YheO